MKTVKEIIEIFNKLPSNLELDVRYLNNDVRTFISIDHIVWDLTWK